MSGAKPDQRTPIAVARRIPRATAALPPRSQSDESAPSTSGTLSVTVSRFDGWTLVAFAGVIDRATAPELHSVLQEFRDQSVSVDLDDATFSDVTGLRTLMRAREQIILAGGRLSIRSSRPNLQKEFERTGLAESIADDPVTA